MLHIAWHESRSARDNARRELPALVSSYFTYVRQVLAKDPPARDLHKLRLATKRLRYTLELFRPVYGPGMEERLATVRKVQQRLGDVNDSVAAWDLLGKKLQRSPGRVRVRTFLHDRAEKQARQFRLEWKRLFDTPGREEWWTQYLAGRRPRTG